LKIKAERAESEIIVSVLPYTTKQIIDILQKAEKGLSDKEIQSYVKNEIKDKEIRIKERRLFTLSSMVVSMISITLIFTGILFSDKLEMATASFLMDTDIPYPLPIIIMLLFIIPFSYFFYSSVVSQDKENFLTNKEESLDKGCHEINIEKLQKYQGSLRFINFLNLFIGIIAFVLGMVFLFTFDFEQENLNHVWERLALRFSVSILVNAFAYYFLSLYKRGLQEVRYFQNELTNLYNQATAIELASKEDNSIILNSLLNDDRNKNSKVADFADGSIELLKGLSKSDLDKLEKIISVVKGVIK
jgi:hypothetical protein